MRFSAAIPRPQPVRSTTAADLIRRLVAGKPFDCTDKAPPRPDEPPPDLDQRVRLVGEW